MANGVKPAETGYFPGRDGTYLYYQTRGTGPPVLGFNGVGCAASTFWRYAEDGLSDDHRVILWDYPGHGMSGAPRDWKSLSIPEVAATGMALLDHLNISRAVLMGHSMGVQTVLEAAHRFTDRVAGLILVCGAYGHPIDYFLHTSLIKYLVPIPYILSRSAPRAFTSFWRTLMTGELSRPVARLIGMHPYLAPKEDMDNYFRHMAAINPELFMRMVRYMQEHTAEPYLPKITTPTLIVAGREDHFTPYWLSLSMHERLPNSRLLTVPEGSHVSHIEMPRLVERAIRSFLVDECLTPRPARPAVTPCGQAAAPAPVS